MCQFSAIVCKLNLISWIQLIFLQSVGLFENYKMCLIYIIVHFIFFTIGILGSVIGFLNTAEGRERLQSSNSITVQLFAVAIFVQLSKCRKSILNLLAAFKKDEITIHGISDQINQLLAKRLMWLFGWTLLLCIAFQIPTIYNFFQGDITNSKETLEIPFWFSCSVENTSRSRLSSVCWKITTKRELLVTNLFQAVVMIWITVIHLASFVLFSITVAQLVKHLECIKVDLRSFKQKAMEEVALSREWCENNKDDSKEFIQVDEMLIESFLKIFKHQQFLYRQTLQMVKTWKGFVTCYSASCNTNVILSLFILRTELHGSKSIALKSLMVILFLFLVAYIISYSTQAISDLVSNNSPNNTTTQTTNFKFVLPTLGIEGAESHGVFTVSSSRLYNSLNIPLNAIVSCCRTLTANEDIFQELIEIQWYELSLRFRKIYLTTLILNQTSIKMKIAGAVELNLNTYGKMLKTAYSILNILLLKYGK